MPENDTRPKILLIPDVPNWIFDRHAKMLQSLLQDEFDFSVRNRGELYNEDDYDLIYPFEYNMVQPEQIRRPEKHVTGIRSFVSWYDLDFADFIEVLATRFQRVHVVSRQLYDVFCPFLPGLKYVTHGIDTQVFQPRPKALSGAGKLRLGWAGNRTTFVKGYAEIIQPLIGIPGVELVSCGFADKNLSMSEMPDFYQSIDAYISASSYEGNNNTVLESAAMETAVITTHAGTVDEYLVHRESALIVDRTPEAFREAVLELRDSPDLRLRLGKRARQAILNGGWDWKTRAEDYRIFFRESLAAVKSGIKPQASTLSDATPADWLRASQCQNDLLRQSRLHYLRLTGGEDILKSLDEKSAWIIQVEAYARELEIKWAVVEYSRLLKLLYLAKTGQLYDRLRSRMARNR
jgi:glycosyltransferase involved in cell wall biosynthesis